MKGRVFKSFLGVAVLSLLSPSQGFARVCGGSRSCSCGDSVTEDYAMTSDLGPCVANGLVVRTGATLDCQMHVIRGSGNISTQYGIQLRKGTTAVTVKNCRVEGFRHGIRLKGASRNRIRGNNFSHNGDFAKHVGYGIAAHSESNDNLFEGNRVYSNADEGIHFGESDGNKVIRNDVYDNYRENIYLLRSDRGVFKANKAWGGGSNSLYVKHSSFNRFEANTFQDLPARIRGDSHDNQFRNNDVVNTGIDFQFYVERGKRSYPRRNLVDGGTISGGKRCVSFLGASENAIRDVTLSDCQIEIASSFEGIPQENRLIGVVLNPHKLWLKGNSRILVGWLVNVSLEDPDRALVEGARVRAYDVEGRLVFETTTQKNGNIPTQQVIQYTQTKAKKVIDTPHTLHVETDHAKALRTLTIDQNKEIAIQLESR